jgi:G3E family GTPase
MEVSPPNFDKSYNTEENKPKTLHLTTPEDVDREKLVSFLETVYDDCYRIKGFLELSEGWNQVDVVGKRIDFKPVRKREEGAVLVFISKIGPHIIKPIFAAWERHVGTAMKLR